MNTRRKIRKGPLGSGLSAAEVGFEAQLEMAREVMARRKIALRELAK